jgi:hypothetical protein
MVREKLLDHVREYGSREYLPRKPALVELSAAGCFGRA